MKLPTLSRRFWIACSTLAVIGALFAYYLMVYVAGREEKLREEKYRALARYGENMIHMRTDYYNGLLRNWEKGREQYDSAKKSLLKVPEKKTETPKTTRTLDRLYRSKKDQSCQSCYDVYTLAEKIDSLQNIEISSGGPSRLPAADRAALEKKLNDLVKKDFDHVQYDGYKREMQLDSLLHDHFDRIYFKFDGKSNNKGFGLFSIATKDFVYRPNQFDEFLIIKKYDESRHEHDGEHVVSANESYQTFSNRVDLREIDSLMVVEKGLLTSRFGEIKLADTKFKLFAHSIEFSPGESWILCGLMKVENFNNQVRSVDSFVITTAILMMLFLLIAMPILKLVLMNSFERLTKVNVWFTGFSVVCGSAVFLLITWSESDNLQTREKVNCDLKEFADTIKNKFEQELIDIYDQLKTADTQWSDKLIQYRKDMALRRGVENEFARRDSTVVKGSFVERVGNRKQGDGIGDSVIDKVYNTPLNYPYFNFLIWINGQGIPVITLSNKSIGDDYPMPELAGRKYFSWAMHDSLWYLPQSEPSDRKLFTLQSISSWTDNEIEAGMAIPLSKPRGGSENVVMISTRLHSIMNPLMQPGYGFCLIDETGEVWFHSNPDKNHQQNFVGEVNEKSLVRSAIEGRIATHFDAEYEGNRCQFYMQPVDNIPLHLVVYHDNEYQRAPVILALFFTFFLVVLFFLLQGLQLFMLFLCERRAPLSASHQTQYFLRVIRPDEANADLYRRSSVAMISVLIVCIVLYGWGGISVGVFFISLPILTMIFQQEMYLRNKKKNEREWLFLGLSIFLVFMIDLVSFGYLTAPYRWATAIIQILVAVQFGWVAMVHKRGEETTVEPKQANWINKAVRWFGKYPRVYYVNLTVWLILISLLPVSFFYKFTRDEEWLMWTRYEQLEISRLEYARLKLLDRKMDFFNGDVVRRKAVNEMGRYLSCNDACDDCEPQKDAAAASHSTEALTKLLFSVWPRLSDPFGISSATAPKAAADVKWSWHISAEDESIVFTPDYRKLSTDSLSYFKKRMGFNPIGGPFGFWVLLLIVVCFVSLVRVIQFCTKHIFGIGFIPDNATTSAQELQDKIKAMRKVFVIGLPSSGKTNLASKALPDAKPIDFRDEGAIPAKFENAPYIIQHFEYGINDHALNQKKLNCIKDLLKSPDRQVVILSTMHPCVMTDVYRRWISDMKDDNKEQDKDDKMASLIREYKTAVRNWKDLLGEFDVHYKSIWPEGNAPTTQHNITEELNACHYLQPLKVSPEFQQAGAFDDEVIFRVEEIAESYYQALWSALSHNEKLFLMDLANDGFVNLKSRATLRMLMLKGVIARKGSSLAIMNDSFRHFVTGQFKEDDEIELTKQIAKKGTWHSIQLVLVLVLAAIVIFIALAQEQLFKNLNALIVALTGALALLARFGGLFGTGAKSKD